MKRLVPLLTLFPLLFLGRDSRAEDLVAILSSKSAHYQQALAGFSAAMGRDFPVIYLDESTDEIPAASRVVVTFGAKAAFLKHPPGATLIYCLAPAFEAQQKASNPRSVGVRMLPRPQVLLSELKEIQPRMKRLAVLWHSASLKEYVDGLRNAQADALKLHADRLDSPGDLADRLREVVQTADAVWLAPDPALVNAKNFEILKDFSAANHIPFYAPTSGLVEKGAVAAVSISYSEIGRAAGQAAQGALSGKKAEPVLFPDSVEIHVNREAARKAGLALSLVVLKRARRVDP